LGIKMMGKSWGIKLACSWESQEPESMVMPVRTREEHKQNMILAPAEHKNHKLSVISI
jgi:hypothetical protein